MKYYILLLLSILTFNLHSNESLGLDSGGEEIILHKNGKDSDIALLIVGGIHGDERETISVVKYLKDNLEANLAMYFIPSVNPTLFKEDVSRRGYLSEQLDGRGYVKAGSQLTDYNKGLYYRIFYGNNKTYKNGIDHYIDPNRDFLDRKLPSTRILIDFISELSIKHSEVIIISIHGYMSGGRVYPEYTLDSNKDIIVDPKTWEMTVALGHSSGFKPEKMYSPAIPILDRFRGEFIAYTGLTSGVTAMDIELDGEDNKNNHIRSLNGVKALTKFLLEK